MSDEHWPLAKLHMLWEAYILGLYPLSNGDQVIQPKWKWYATMLGRTDAIPEFIPPNRKTLF